LKSNVKIMLKGLEFYQNQLFVLRKKENYKNRANRLVRKQRIDNRNRVKISEELKSEYPSKCAEGNIQQCWSLKFIL
jgi:hypothetical protein